MWAPKYPTPEKLQTCGSLQTVCIGIRKHIYAYITYIYSTYVCVCIFVCIYIYYIYYIYMLGNIVLSLLLALYKLFITILKPHCVHVSDCENPRFTERTSTNLGRSHRLPHVCTIMIYGKLGGYRLQETAAFIYIYICDELWIICDIWVSLMWILERYDDITLKRGIANLGRSHRLPRVFNNFHQFP